MICLNTKCWWKIAVCRAKTKTVKTSILLTSLYHLEGVDRRISRTAERNTGGVFLRFQPFCYFTNLWDVSRHWLTIENNAYIRHVSHSLTMVTHANYEHDSNDVTEIWRNKTVLCGEINERSFSNPHPQIIMIWFYTECRMFWKCNIFIILNLKIEKMQGPLTTKLYYTLDV